MDSGVPHGVPSGMRAGEVMAESCSPVARTMGWLPFAKSMSERRRCPSAMPLSASRYWPSPSGPRCAMMSHMALSAGASALVAWVNPQIPHMQKLLHIDVVRSRAAILVWVGFHDSESICRAALFCENCGNAAQMGASGRAAWARPGERLERACRAWRQSSRRGSRTPHGPRFPHGRSLRR